MTRNKMRFSGWVGIVLLLALVLISGCTRSKSSGPPKATAEESSAATSQPSGTEPSPTLVSGDDALAVTATAWAVKTATAAAQPSQGTAVPTAETLEPTRMPKSTGVAEPTKAPESTESPEPTEAPGSTKEPQITETPATVQPPSSGEVKIHTVQLDENLFRIALSYRLTTQALASYNGIANPNLIYVGQRLKIPTTVGVPVAPPFEVADYHIVQLDENLFRIALQYDLLFDRLAEANGLSYPYTIYPGQRLIIP